MGSWEQVHCYLVRLEILFYVHDDLQSAYFLLSRSITDLPPLANITNSVGRIVLGQFNGNGEKLYLGT